MRALPEEVRRRVALGPHSTNRLIPTAFLYRPLGRPQVNRGTRLAHIGNMPDVQPDAAPENPSKKKKKKWPAVVLVLVLAGAGIFVWLRPGPSTSAAEGAVEPTLALETFVVNLSGSGQRAYLRVAITLGLAHALPHNQPEAVPTALVRDTILSVLATAQPEGLFKAEGKRQLKDELLKALQERVPQLAVENVYFTEFLVQM
jgi:flagellar basal body-associated protein FliL